MKMSLFNENGAFLLKSAIFIKKVLFLLKWSIFTVWGLLHPPAASPGGLPGGPRGVHGWIRGKGKGMDLKGRWA